MSSTTSTTKRRSCPRSQPHQLRHPLSTESAHIHGKGAKDRRVRIGRRTSRAVSKYLRARNKRQGSDEVPELWLAERGLKPLRPNGIKIRLKRLGAAAGIDGCTDLLIVRAANYFDLKK